MFNAKILVARNQDIKKLLNEYNKCNLNPSKCAVQICQKPKCPLLCDPFDQPDRRTDRATNPLPPSPYLRARSPRLKSTRFHVDGGGRATTTQRRSARYAYAGCGRTDRAQAAPTGQLGS